MGSGAHSHPPKIGTGLLLLAAGAVGCAVLSGRAGHAAHRAARAADAVLHAVLLAGLGVLGLAVLAACGLVALHVRRSREPREVERGWTAEVVSDAPASGPRLTAMPPASVARLDPPPAAPREVHYHVHLPEGTDPAAIAEALRNGGPA